LIFTYPLYNHNWRNISTIYIYNKTSIKQNILRGADKSLARPERKQATATRFWFSLILFIIIIGGILVLFIYITRLASNEIFSGVLISPYPDQEGNKLQRQKILIFIYPIYNHNWRNISTIYIYNKTSIKRNILRGADKSLARPERKQAKATRLWFSLILFIIIIGGILVLFIYIIRLASNEIFSRVLISPYPDQKGNKLQRQKILMFIYPIYNYNWRNISTIYIYITKLASNEIF